MAEKIFIGNVKEVPSQYGDIISLGLSEQDIQKLQQYKNASGYMNISILNSKNGGKYAVVNTYGLDSKPASSTLVKRPMQFEPEDDLDPEDVPF